MRIKIASMVLCFVLVCAITQMGTVKAQEEGSTALLGAGLGALSGALSGALCSPIGALCSIPISLIMSICAMPIQMLWSCITPVWVSVQSVIGTFLGAVWSLITPLYAVLCAPVFGALSGLCSVFISVITTIFQKIVAVLPLVIGIFEPVLEYIQSVLGGAIVEYVAGYKDLIYYGFIRPVLLDIALALFGVVLIIVDVIGLIPIVSIPIAIIFNLLIFFVGFPLGVSAAAYYPIRNIDNAMAQGATILKMFVISTSAVIVAVILAILLLLYDVGMFIPILNIIWAFWTLFCIVGILGIILILIPIFAWATNLCFAIPTVFNYTAIVNAVGNAIRGIPNTLQTLCFRVLDACGAWCA